MFGAFAFVIGIVLATFVFRIFKRMKREMLLSNRILYMIDYEIVTDVVRKEVDKFLQAY